MYANSALGYRHLSGLDSERSCEAALPYYQARPGTHEPQTAALVAAGAAYAAAAAAAAKAAASVEISTADFSPVAADAAPLPAGPASWD